MLERIRKTYILRENLFMIGEIKDVDFPFFGKPLSSYASEKFEGIEVDKMPVYHAGETLLILRSSHTCLPRLGVESLLKKAEKTGENIFFGAGWVVVSKQPIAEARYDPLYGGVTFLSLVDLPFVMQNIRLEIIKKHLKNGVVIESDNGVYIDTTVSIEKGAYISHDVTLLGNTVVESSAKIKPYTIIEDGYVRKGAEVGPFARLRKGSVIGERAKIGNFVEVKNATVGACTKASHLAYIGDADVGMRCNIGCGSIFVNYNGKIKQKTLVEDDCFVGSNANLIAPVTMKKGSYLAAGSTLTKDLDNGDLCIARQREEIFKNRADRYYKP